MRASVRTREFLMKALRMALVFSLVFWGSFRIEMVAFADDDALAADQPAQTGDDSGDDPSQSDPPDGGEGPGSGDEGGPGDDSGNQGDQGGQGEQGGPGDAPDPENPPVPPEPEQTAPSIENFRIHLASEHPDPSVATSRAGALVYDAKTQASSSPAQVNVPAIEKPGGTLEFVPVIEVKSGDAVTASIVGADALEWRVEGAGAEIARFVVGADGRATSVLQATGAKNGDVVVTCKLKYDEKVYQALGLPSDARAEVAFTVKVTNQEPFIESIELLGEDGELLTTEALNLDIDQGKPVAYQFSARVTIRESAEEGAAKHTFTTADADIADEKYRELLGSLEWSVDDTANASIDQTGLFSTDKRLVTIVRCSANSNDTSKVSAMIRVNTGIDASLQGEYNPQSTLVVEAPENIMKGYTGDSPADGETAAEPGESDEGPDADQPASDEPGEPAEPGDDAGEGEGAQPAPIPTVERAYTLEELSALSSSSIVVRTLQGGAAGGSTTTIAGIGPELSALLDDAGIDLGKVETVTFYAQGGSARKHAWDELSSTGAIMALKSLVLAEGEDAPADEEGLLGNTRYRLLPGEGGSYDMAYSWVYKIGVNVEETGSGGVGGKQSDGSLLPVIYYIPVPKGYTAVLTVVVGGLYEGEQFGPTWQVEGASAAKNDGAASQTVRVDVSDATLGDTYTVVVSTDRGRESISETVTIREPDADDFAVSLAYDPPKAGGVAIFNSKLYNIDTSEVLDYIWEYTEDSGNTWNEVAGSRGRSTFSVQTDPIEDSPDPVEDQPEGDEPSADDADGAAEEDETPASAVWVRVRVEATGGREAISNPVMLTVHVNEEGSGQPAVDEPTDAIEEEPSVPGSDDEVLPVDDPPATEQTPAAPAEPTITEVDSIVVETAPRERPAAAPVSTSTPATEQTPDGTETAPTPESAAPAPASDEPMQIVVNPSVTAEIIEQQEAVDAAVQASRPGARWTALTTVDPDGKDVQRILDDNPFVPLTAPFALGLTAAGFVEKLAAFRRQTRPLD